MMLEDIYTKEEKILFSSCNLCPRECRADRTSGNAGYCGLDAGMNIASICIHKGEEPPVSGEMGICNIFFSGCNLRCIYCQNYDISRPSSSFFRSKYSYQEALDEIERILSDGVRAVGFVSPSHVVPQVKALIRGLHDRGLRPLTIYNTNAYDKPEVIDSLDGMIDVYLPDYKYVSSSIAKEYSDASDYPEVALRALQRMYYQKGSLLLTDREGRAENGILIRHLVLPGHAEESMKVLETIAEELSPGVSISLMSQYYPTPGVSDHTLLNRPLYKEEYGSVVCYMKKLGFRNGWLQDMNSYLTYRPDFKKDVPF